MVGFPMQGHILLSLCHLRHSLYFAFLLQFLNTTKTDIMLSFPSNDGLMTAARAALFFALLFSYPVLLHPARSAINQLISFCLELYLKRTKNRGGEGGGNLVNGSDSEHDVLLSDHTDDPPSSSLCARKQLVILHVHV